MKRIVLALAIAVLPAWQPSARAPPSKPNHARSSVRPRFPRRPSSRFPDMKGVVSWKTLAQVELVKVKDRAVPQYSDGVLKLERDRSQAAGLRCHAARDGRQAEALRVRDGDAA